MEYLFKVTAKKNNKSVSKTLTLTAKVVNASLKVTNMPETMIVNDEVTLTKSGAPSEATVDYTSDNTDVVAVDGSKITAKAAGEANITATSSYGKTVTYKVAVKNAELQEVKQTKANTIEATVKGDTSKLTKADFAIVNTKTNAVVAVNTVAADAGKVTITTFNNMADGNVYSVTLDGISKEFTATDGTVVAIEIAPTTVPSGRATKITATAKDANGVEIDSIAYGAGVSGYTFTITTATGYTTGDSLYLPNTGDTATANVVKHTYKYDTTGKEIGTIETGDVTITAIDPSAASNFNVRLADDNTKKYDDLKDGAQISVGGTKYAVFKITDANASEIPASEYANYTVESSDATVLQVATTSLAGSGAGNGVAVYGLKEGTAYILVKNNNTVVASLPITVIAAAKATTLTLDKNSFVISNEAVGEKVEVNATVKDQFGNNFTVDSDVDVTCEACPAATTKTAAQTIGTGIVKSVANGKITFQGEDKDAGTYVFKVTYTKNGNTTTPAYVSVEVKAATGAVNYQLVIEDNGVATSGNYDTKITDSNNQATKDFDLVLYKTQGGVKKDEVNSAIKVNGVSVKKDGKDCALVTTGAGIYFENGIAGADELKVRAVANSGNVITKLASGEYTILVDYLDGSNTGTARATLKITDSQSALTVSQKKNTTSDSSITAMFGDADSDAFSASNADGTVAVTDVKGTCIKQSVTNASLTGATFASGDVITVTEVTATVTIGSVTYTMTANVNFVVTVQ
ncbi:MAG: hypothetical protein NC355_05140 [Blautia sp.]|nr:hypothetical protein [Blautia sp.]